MRTIRLLVTRVTIFLMAVALTPLMIISGLAWDTSRFIRWIWGKKGGPGDVS